MHADQASSSSVFFLFFFWGGGATGLLNKGGGAIGFLWNFHRYRLVFIMSAQDVLIFH